MLFRSPPSCNQFWGVHVGPRQPRLLSRGGTVPSIDVLASAISSHTQLLTVLKNSRKMCICHYVPSASPSCCTLSSVVSSTSTGLSPPDPLVVAAATSAHASWCSVGRSSTPSVPSLHTTNRSVDPGAPPSPPPRGPVGSERPRPLGWFHLRL